MYDFIPMHEFCQQLHDRPELTEKASAICEALLAARSPRLSDLIHRMSGSPSAYYKALQRVLDLITALQRLFYADTPPARPGVEEIHGEGQQQYQGDQT